MTIELASYIQKAREKREYLKTQGWQASVCPDCNGRGTRQHESISSMMARDVPMSWPEEERNKAIQALKDNPPPITYSESICFTCRGAGELLEPPVSNQPDNFL